MSETHRDFVIRQKAHCFDPGHVIGHPPSKKTLDEVREDIARVNAERGCEILTLLPSSRR